MTDCEQTFRAIERAFVKHDTTLLARVRPHLARCEQCQTIYHRLFEAEACLGRLDTDDGQPRLLSFPEQEVLRDLVLRPAPSHRRWSRLVPYLSVVALTCLVLLWVVVIPRAPEPADTFTPRGAKGPTPEGASLSVRALCLTPSDQGLQARSLVSARCTRSGVLGFTYRNVTATPWHLQLVALTADGKALRVLAPSGEKEEPLGPTTDEVPLPATVRLGQVAPGRLAIYGVFSREILDTAALIEDVPAGRLDGQAAGSGERHVVRIVITIED